MRRNVHHDVEARFCLLAAYIRQERTINNEHDLRLKLDTYLECVLLSIGSPIKQLLLILLNRHHP